ncbi:DNA-binding protein [Cupriavidus respiraculi]|uniref:DNA-binding protein n=2 Tax=Cupriavidus respiraculi TaxID=195930 RepID=A0ABM8WE45_9BURK|nr:hypothetical protein LMG21510_00145 [Cupriavidus respiraculi]
MPMHENPLKSATFRYDSVAAAPTFDSTSPSDEARCSSVQLILNNMATKAKPSAKTETKPAGKKAAATKAPAKKAAPVKAAAKQAAPAKKAATAAAVTPRPLKDTFNKSSLVAHLVAQTQVDAKAVKTVLAHLENTIVSALNKKGAGEFTLPGLMKITAQQVPAKKKRFGKDPFSGEERWFPAKPASVKVKVRPLKKLKDAAA